jgi:hypothetical protein
VGLADACKIMKSSCADFFNLDRILM